MIKTQLKSAEKNTTVVSVTVPVSTVSTHRQEALKHLAEHVELKGFRKGKAPLAQVEKALDPQKVESHTLERLMRPVLTQVFKDHDLKLIGNPRLIKLNQPKDQDWELELSLPLEPQFELGDYQKVVREALPKEKKKLSPDQKHSLVFDALLKHIDFDLPQALIDEEVNQSLSRLLDQVNTLGLTIQDYLKSLGKTSDQLKAEYEKAAQDNLKLELILNKIATAKEIKVEDKEIDALIAASGDEKAKTKLNTPAQRQYLTHILKKRKTIDSLLQL